MIIVMTKNYLLGIKKIKAIGCGCGTAVERASLNQEVVGSIQLRARLFSVSIISSVSLFQDLSGGSNTTHFLFKKCADRCSFGQKNLIYSQIDKIVVHHLNLLLPHQEHEFVRNHLGVVFAVAANNPNPLETFRHLTQVQQKQQQDNRASSYPQYLRANTLKYYVLVRSGSFPLKSLTA